MNENLFHWGYNGEPILDEQGVRIPSYICICHAHDEFECSCGAWDIPLKFWKEELDSSDEETKKYVKENNLAPIQ